MNLSVVIATLGGEQLGDTIISINKSYLRPSEIIIAIPAQFSSNVLHLQSDNVKILLTNSKGQVAQRCEGFKVAKGEFVIQLDDDIILEKDCISLLIAAMHTLGHKAVCSPAFFFKQTGISVYQRPINNPWLARFYYWILNGSMGYVEGVITKAGTEIGINSANHSENIIKTEWLPGGMVVHRQNNLIMHNYFPHEGKAFSEDLYHSIELSKKGLNLFVITNARAYLDDPRTQNPTSILEWWANIKKDYATRKYLVSLSSKSYFRMFFFYVFSLLAYISKLNKKNQ
jgi:glycosyltransferase involved in cell wall biosynthesis